MVGERKNNLGNIIIIIGREQKTYMVRAGNVSRVHNVIFAIRRCIRRKKETTLSTNLRVVETETTSSYRVKNEVVNIGLVYYV